MLKGRLAEAVRDEGLKRELRRLNVESPDLDFFEARDRALQWLGGDTQDASKSKATLQETLTKESLIEETLRKQNEMLQKQQKNIEAILAKMSSGSSSSSRGSGNRQAQKRCWKCGSPDHLKRDCPQNDDSQNNSGN